MDVIPWLVEPSTFIGAGERHIAEQLNKVKTPIILVINKIDTVKNQDEILYLMAACHDVCDFVRLYSVCPEGEEYGLAYRADFQVPFLWSAVL